MSRRPRLFVLVLAFVLLLLTPLASRLPDGLMRVATDLGFARRAAGAGAGAGNGSALQPPMPGYSVPALSSVRLTRLGSIVAGLIGAGAVFLALKGVEVLLRKGVRRRL